MAIKKPKTENFEVALKELETIVAAMERGGLTLEESLSNFEKGVGLVKQCQSFLKEAEQKVKILTTEGKLVNYDTDEEDDEI
jgi:exodeoxyribonuclease VII small subunit